MAKKHFLRGMATVNFWAEYVIAARDWYAELFGVGAYFQQPNPEQPAYVEFRIGDAEDEFGIIDRKCAPKAMQPGPGGAILLWHVDDIEAAFERLKAMGAKEYDPITKRGETGFVMAPSSTRSATSWESCTTRTMWRCLLLARSGRSRSGRWEHQMLSRS